LKAIPNADAKFARNKNQTLRKIHAEIISDWCGYYVPYGRYYCSEFGQVIRYQDTPIWS
jgi:hypothetical protein